MLLASSRKLFNLILIIGLVWSIALMGGLAPARGASGAGRSLPAGSNSLNTTVPAKFLPQTDDVNQDPINLTSMGSLKPDELVQVSAITDTLTFTTTEDFTTYTHKDTVHTTADWDTFNGVLKLPRLLNPAGQSSPSVAVDTAGNSYVVWQDDRNDSNEGRDPDIYAQKFDAGGKRLWPADVRVNSDRSASYQVAPTVVLDAAGNLVIVWESGGIYVQKLDPTGQKLWDTDRRVDDSNNSAIPEYCDAALDPSTGDVVVVWKDARNGNGDIYIQRLKADGSPRWTGDKRVNTDSGTIDQYSPAVGVDAAGNAYVVWEDNRRGDYDIWAQKLNPNGIRLWADLRVNSDSGTSDHEDPAIATDAEGYSYVVWNDDRDGSGAVYAQKLSAYGEKQWRSEEDQPEDRPVNRSSFSFIVANDPSIALNDNGNAFVTWAGQPCSLSCDSDIYVQKIDTSGNRLWPDDRQVNSDADTQSTPTIAVNTGVDIRIAWQDFRGEHGNAIYMQHLNLNGDTLWLNDLRVKSNVGVASEPPVIAANTNSSHVVWEDGRNGVSYRDVYAQKLDASGNLQWRDDLRVNEANSGVFRLSIAVDITGTVAAAWGLRWGDGVGIYVQTLSADGALRWPVDVRVSSGSNPAITMDSSDNLYVVWEDYRNDRYHPDIYIQKLNSNGVKQWADDRRVNTDTITVTQSYPAITFDDYSKSLYVVWQDHRNDSSYGDIYAQRLDLDGNHLCAEDIWVNSDSSLAMQLEPAVAAAGGYAYVAWKDWRSSSYKIYAQKLTSDCNKEWPGDLLIGAGYNPAVAASVTGDTYVIWRFWDNDNYDIYARKLDPAGNKVWPADVQVNSDDGWTNQYDPGVGVDDTGNAYVVWQDYRRGSPDIYAQKLLPDGSKSWAGDIRINPDLYLATAEARSLSIDNTSENIAWATLTVSSTLPTTNTVSYLLSNNGGDTWEEVTPGSQHTFGTAGSDLRWRMILAASVDQTETPVIDWVQVKYSIDPDANAVLVFDENGLPAPGARIYRSRQFAGVTDNEGSLIIPDLQAGDTLTALQPVYERPTNRAGHDPDGSGGFAFRVYRTSMPVNDSGEVEYYTVQGSDQHHILTISSDNTLILFNLVVSIEWDATDEYLDEIAHAVQHASDYLYDLTDGQMAFGQVAIYDSGRYWADADIQISTKNIVHPHAYVGGITSYDKSHVIQVGRGWDGNSGNQGPWDQPNGYRTLAHEFGHYALYLYDEYFAYNLDGNGNLTGEAPASCTGPENRNPATDATNASAMDYQYTASELAMQGVPGLWSSLCEATAQVQLNAESDWETIIRRYADTASPPRWQFTTPADRGSVVAGPDGLPSALPNWPLVKIHQNPEGPSDPPRHLTVYGPQGRYWGALVTLYTNQGSYPVAIDQGFTDQQGEIDVYGAQKEDILRAASLDGALSDSVSVTDAMTYTLTMTSSPTRLRSLAVSGLNPYLSIHPSSDGNTLYFRLYGLGPGGTLVATVTRVGGTDSQTTALSYSSSLEAYIGSVAFSASHTPLGMGTVQVVGAGVGSQGVTLNSTYALQSVPKDHVADLYSADGNAQLHLITDTLPVDAYAVLSPLSAAPTAPPEGWQIVGNVYDVRFSGALEALQKPALLKLHYDGALVNSSSAPDGLGIYRWDPTSETWQAVSGSLDKEQKAVVAPMTTPQGVYALLAPPACYDVTRDDQVNMDDVQAVAGRWHGLLPYDSDYDMVLDGTINTVDIMKVAAHWGQRCGGT